MSTFMLLLIFASFNKFINHFSIYSIFHFPFSLFVSKAFHISTILHASFLVNLVTVINFFDSTIMFHIISYNKYLHTTVLDVN